MKLVLTLPKDFKSYLGVYNASVRRMLKMAATRIYKTRSTIAAQVKKHPPILATLHEKLAEIRADLMLEDHSRTNIVCILQPAALRCSVRCSLL